MDDLVNQLNNEAGALGVKIFNHVIGSGDATKIHKLKIVIIDIFNEYIHLVETKADYITWRNAHIRANRKPLMAELDPSREYMRIANTLESLNMVQHYLDNIVPTYERGPQELINDRDLSIEILDRHIDECCTRNRRAFKVVLH